LEVYDGKTLSPLTINKYGTNNKRLLGKIVIIYYPRMIINFLSTGAFGKWILYIFQNDRFSKKEKKVL